MNNHRLCNAIFYAVYMFNQRRSLKIANDTSFDLFQIVFLLLSACVRSHGDHIASISPAGMVTCDIGYEYLDGQPVCNGTTKVGSCTRKL